MSSDSVGPCPTCNGQGNGYSLQPHGEMLHETCHDCGGSGDMPEPEIIALVESETDAQACACGHPRGWHDASHADEPCRWCDCDTFFGGPYAG